ncbi:RNA 2',3'-cyclic phosphodiesterase [Prolixibacter sp. SD074]|jgi:2'-5' RNA ligase|uniref:RNA 2',3'-cyclic phosphodiesterase n=1 Tax=Prolixibacter sp. SD074 TaxID=2652391 RepID=UPI0012855153|nr:RNA 2',3'-cyclic phosphodiesterase [Prolixibacter sp. SD074]GET30870.1 RNA 2',3'-cyclic phosphodiesterase [Prolixibacter sp. SD074]
MSKRTFIAVNIKPEEKLLAFIHELQRELGRSHINWVNPATMHLTLRFLGSTTKEQIGQILNEAPGLFNRYKPFEIEMKGSGKFGSVQNPKIFWIGFEENEALSGLAREVESLVQSVGFESEDRIFRPHLTLGRVKWLKEADNLKKKLEDYREVTFQRMMIKETVFYESILKPAGPFYRPIQKFSLGA